MKPFAARAQSVTSAPSGTCASRAAFLEAVARRDTHSRQLTTRMRAAVSPGASALR